MKKFKLIVPSFVALIFCMLLIAGSTFALFTSQATASIAVTSGKVQITATLGEPKLYSADATLTSGDLAGTITESTKTDDNESYANYAGTYYFKQQTGTFANGGTAVVANNKLTLSKMTPGDKAEAGLAIVNSSNVNIKYRLILEAHASGKNDDNVDNADLLSVLKVTFFDKTYIGLSKFVSAWMFREAVETPENLDTGLVIELPLLTDNHYQDLEVSYTITVEAVQGNAKTVDAGLTEYVDKPATQTGTAATTVTQETASASIKLTTTTTPLQEGTTIAEFNNAFEVASEGESTVKLDVETAPFETASQTAYTVVAQDATPVASVDLNLTVDGETVTAFKEGGSSKITTYVLKGLNDISVVYNGDNTKAFGAGQEIHRKYIKEEVLAVGDYFYNPGDGELVFVTDHFSEYVPVTKDALTFINMTQSKAYSSGTFQTILDEAAANDQINVMKDTSMNAPLMVSKSIKIEGNNHKFTSTGNRAIRINTNNVSLEINNLDIIGGSGCERGVQIDSDKEKCEIKLDNVDITGISFYAINVCGGCVDPSITIKNSHIEAWGAINLWSESYSVLIEDSELVGVNDKSYDPAGWNGFGVVVLEGDTTGETTTHSANVDVTIKNTKIRGSQTTGNKQSLILFNNPSANNRVSLINCELLGLDDSNVELVLNCGQGNKLYIDGVDYETGNVWNGQTYEKLSSRPWLKNDKFVAAPSQAEQIANTDNGSIIIAADNDEEFASYIGQATAYVQSIQNDTTLGINITDLGNQSGVLHVTNAKGLSFLSQFTDYLSALNAIEASKGNWYSDYYYYWNWTISVDCDINLCNIAWRPLDDPSCVVDFNNHTISNLLVYNKNSAGLFNLASKGVRNLTIDHATVTADGIGDSCAGALAGSAHGTVQNITVKNSTVSNAKYSAVLVGYSYANIANCTVQDSSVDGRYKTGSLVGYLCSSTSGLVSNNTIKNVAVSTTNVLPGKTAVNGTVIGQFNAPGQCINNVLVNVTGASVKVGDTNGHAVEVD